MRWLAVGMLMLAVLLLIVVLRWVGLGIALVSCALCVALLAGPYSRRQLGAPGGKPPPRFFETRLLLTDWRTRPDQLWLGLWWWSGLFWPPLLCFPIVVLVYALALIGLLVQRDPWALAGIPAWVLLLTWAARQHDPYNRYDVYESCLVLTTRRGEWRVIDTGDVAEVLLHPQPFSRRPPKVRVLLRSGSYLDLAPTEPEVFAGVVNERIAVLG